MSIHARTVQLHPRTFDQLELEASRRHLAADELADELVRAALAESAARSATSLRDALAVLDAQSLRMPEIDALPVVSDGRGRLGARMV
jgi:hypothetical protein